jgi:hypothetical protein
MATCPDMTLPKSHIRVIGGVIWNLNSDKIKEYACKILINSVLTILGEFSLQYAST